MFQRKLFSCMRTYDSAVFDKNANELCPNSQESLLMFIKTKKIIENRMHNKNRFIKRFPKIDELKQKLQKRNASGLFKLKSKRQAKPQEQPKVFETIYENSNETLKRNFYTKTSFESLTDVSDCESDISDDEIFEHYYYNTDSSMSSIDSFDDESMCESISNTNKMLLFSPSKTSSRKSLLPQQCSNSKLRSASQKYYKFDSNVQLSNKNNDRDNILSSTVMSAKTAFTMSNHADFNDDLDDFVFLKKVAQEKFLNLNESKIF